MKSASSAVSASEVDTFIQCERLWAFKYRWDQGPKTRRRAYFEVGKKFDRIVEDYWKFGIVPAGPDPLNELFMKLIPVIPGPGLHRHLQLQDRWKYNGLPVLTIPDYVGQPGFIGDLKTTKDIKAYGLLTKEQKLTNTQTVMYSFRYLPDGGVFDHWYAQKHRAIELAYEDKTLDPALIELYRTSNGQQGKQKSTALMAPKALGTPIELTRGEIVHAFETHVLPPSERVYQLRNKHARIDPMTMPEAPETENPYDRACAKYGGCEYRDVCFPKAKDFGAANLHRDSTEVKLVFGGDAVKFKIQKPEQIQVESATEAQVEAAKPTGRFAPKAKAKIDAFYAKEAAEAAVSEAKAVADVSAEASPLKVESFVGRLSPEEMAEAADEMERTVTEAINAGCVPPEGTEYISPMNMQKPTNAIETFADEIVKVAEETFKAGNGATEISFSGGPGADEEPTIPVDSLITKEMVESSEKSLPQPTTPDRPGLAFVSVPDLNNSTGWHSLSEQEHQNARALRLGRAMLEILDVLTSK